jgi:hypothetical protein
MIRWEGKLEPSPRRVGWSFFRLLCRTSAEEASSQGATWVIHKTPKWSVTIPKREEKKVLVNGICTRPPSAILVVRPAHKAHFSFSLLWFRAQSLRYRLIRF